MSAANSESAARKPCKRCIERGRPANFGSEPKCAFMTGEFSEDNWQCVTASIIRSFMGEDYCDTHDGDRFYIYRDDESFGAIWVPPNPQDVPDGDEVGPWRGGGLIAGYWYKHRGCTEMLIRVDPRNGGQAADAGKRLTLAEAEAAIENLEIAKRAAEEEVR